MKKSTKIALAALAMILTALLLLVNVPVSLMTMLGVPEGETWQCEILQVKDGLPRTVLADKRTEVLVRRMEHVEVCFRGWAEDTLSGGAAILRPIDPADGTSGEVFRFYLDEQGLLWVNELKFALVGEDGTAFRVALEEAIDAP